MPENDPINELENGYNSDTAFDASYYDENDVVWVPVHNSPCVEISMYCGPFEYAPHSAPNATPDVKFIICNYTYVAQKENLYMPPFNCDTINNLRQCYENCSYSTIYIKISHFDSQVGECMIFDSSIDRETLMNDDDVVNNLVENVRTKIEETYDNICGNGCLRCGTVVNNFNSESLSSISLAEDPVWQYK